MSLNIVMKKKKRGDFELVICIRGLYNSHTKNLKSYLQGSSIYKMRQYINKNIWDDECKTCMHCAIFNACNCEELCYRNDLRNYPLSCKKYNDHLHLDLSVPVSPISERSGGYGALWDVGPWGGRGSFSLADRGSCGSSNR